MEPGVIMIGERLLPIWDMPYSKMVKEFDLMGATRIASQAS
ncbi:MAG: hypothetical protein ACYC6B_03515 [Thermoleophilia bacterium]